MIHDLNPFLWQIYGNFGIRWYGLSYLMGFICGYFIVRFMVSRQKSVLSVEQVGDFLTYLAFGTLIGGRLGYCLFYSPDLFYQFKSTFPFWGVLAVNEGGMASHGGIIGVTIACLLYARKSGASPLYLFDLVAVSGPMGICFGRLANFVNGELVGRVTDATYQFAVRFPQDILSWPSQQFDRLATLDVVMDKIGTSRDRWLELLSKYRMDQNSRGEVYAILEKIVQEIQNGNTAVKESLGAMLDYRHPYQLYGALGEGLTVFLVLFFLWRRPRKPGVVGASFLLVYGIMRIITEQFRVPDVQIGFQLFDLTRGQWLSIGQLVFALTLLFMWGRRDTLPTAGWGRGRNVKLHRK